MTLIEFLAPLKRGTHQSRILAVMFYKKNFEQVSEMTAGDIRKSLSAARAPGAARINVNDVLNRANHYVDSSSSGSQGIKWRLTDSGRKRLAELMDLSILNIAAPADIGTLRSTIDAVSDPEIRDYLEEGAKCLGAGAFRATVVFLWAGAIREIQTQLLSFGGHAATDAIRKHDPKARAVKDLDDFAYIKDSVALLAAKELGIYDKNEKGMLEEALNLRNRCGHPGKYRPGQKKVSSFIEDLVTLVFV